MGKYNHSLLLHRKSSAKGSAVFIAL